MNDNAEFNKDEVHMAKKKSRPKSQGGGPTGIPRDLMSAMLAAFNNLSDDDRDRVLSGKAPLPLAEPRSRKKKASRDPIALAQELVDEAHDAASEEEAGELALEALQHDPKCVEAHLLLGDLARTADEACQSYREAMEAAREQIASEFDEMKGRFWGFLETRPYMMARARLADALWASGKRDEAVAHREALLELNPNDNQGIRYILAVRYLEMRHPEGLRRLLDAYPKDEAPEFMYGRALMLFRAEGDTPAAREALKAAMKANRHVSDYLLGGKRLPPAPPETMTLGGKDEAISYVFMARTTWSSTPEALAWLRDSQGNTRKSKAPKRAKKITVPAKLLRELQALPQAGDEVWQVGPASLPALQGLAEALGENMEGEVLVVAARGEPAPLQMQPVFGDRNRDMWEALTAAMLGPADGRPRRPATVEIDEAAVTVLREPLDRLGIEVRPTADFDAIDACRETLSEAPIERMVKSSQSKPELSTDELAALPPSLEVWQVDLRALPVWLQENGRPQRPWTVLVIEAETGLPYGQSIDIDRPTVEGIWNVICGAMATPPMGEPHRPLRIEVVSDEWENFLAPRCEALGIAVATAAPSSKIDRLLEQFGDPATQEQNRLSLTAIVGTADNVLEGFYEAAALLFRAAPWRTFAMDRVLKITRLDAPRSTWYVTVIGQSGLECGLALYERLDDVRAMFLGQVSPQKAMQRMSCLSLMFEEPPAISFADLDAIERHAWQIAAPEAYPVVMRIAGKGTFSAPKVDELTFLEGAVRLVHAVGNTATAEPQIVTVPTAGCETRFEVTRVTI